MPSARRPPTGRRPAARRPPSRSAPARPSASRARRAPVAGRRSDLTARILVAIPSAAGAVIFVGIGGLPFALLLVALGCVCLHELYGMLARWKPVTLVGFAALGGMVLAAHFGGPRQMLLVAVTSVPVLFLFVIARSGGGGATVAIAGTMLGVFWIGFGFAHAELLRQLHHGNSVLLDVLVGTFLGDTAAYLGGRIFGRRALAPGISPNKTVEGLFCGVLIAILSVFSAGLFQPWLTQGDALLLGLGVAALGPLGDLFESLVKRDAGAKDAGSLFGAHGGALDRLDGVIFTVVAGYYIWVAVLH